MFKHRKLSNEDIIKKISSFREIAKSFVEKFAKKLNKEPTRFSDTAIDTLEQCRGLLRNDPVTEKHLRDIIVLAGESFKGDVTTSDIDKQIAKQMQSEVDYLRKILPDNALTTAEANLKIKKNVQQTAAEKIKEYLEQIDMTLSHVAHHDRDNFPIDLESKKGKHQYLVLKTLYRKYGVSSGFIPEFLNKKDFMTYVKETLENQLTNVAGHDENKAEKLANMIVEDFDNDDQDKRVILDNCIDELQDLRENAKGKDISLLEAYITALTEVHTEFYGKDSYKPKAKLSDVKEQLIDRINSTIIDKYKFKGGEKLKKGLTTILINNVSKAKTKEDINDLFNQVIEQLTIYKNRKKGPPGDKLWSEFKKFHKDEADKIVVEYLEDLEMLKQFMASGKSVFDEKDYRIDSERQKEKKKVNGKDTDDLEMIFETADGKKLTISDFEKSIERVCSKLNMTSEVKDNTFHLKKEGTHRFTARPTSTGYSLKMVGDLPKKAADANAKKRYFEMATVAKELANNQPIKAKISKGTRVQRGFLFLTCVEKGIYVEIPFLTQQEIKKLSTEHPNLKKAIKANMQKNNELKKAFEGTSVRKADKPKEDDGSSLRH